MNEPTLIYDGADWGVKSHVEVTDDEALFEIRQHGNTWRNRVPLSHIVPQASIVTDATPRNQASGLGITILIIAVLLYFEPTTSRIFLWSFVALGLLSLLWGHRFGKRTWATFQTYGWESHSVIGGRDHAAFEQFVQAFESKIIGHIADTQSEAKEVNLLRRIRCPESQFDAYLELLGGLDDTPRLSDFVCIEFVGRSPDGEILERWIFGSEEDRASCEEWLAETNSGRAVAARWTDLGLEMSPFEVWSK